MTAKNDGSEAKSKKSEGSEAKSKLKIKASTGAWWKSKVETEAKAPVETTKASRAKKKPSSAVQETKPAQVAEKVVSESVAKKDPAPPAKAPARKKRATRPARPVAQVESEESKAAPAVKSAKKSGEGKKNEKPVKATEKPVKPVKATEKPAKDVEQASVSSAVSPVPESEVAPKKRPARRRSRSNKKTVAKPEADAATEKVAVESAEVSGKTVDAEVHAGEEKDEKASKSPNRRRSRRPRKRRPVADEQETVAKEVAPVIEEAVATKDDEVSSGSRRAEQSDDIAFSGLSKPKNIRLLINAEEPEECRLALLEDGRLESIHVSTVTRAQTKNNIYKAKVVAIEPNLQAAFVDYGTVKNGFLPFSEIHPEYYRSDLSDSARKNVEERRWRRLKIEDVMARGQELLVQVVKEEVGKKGANMTTYLSLPGRCVVLMPGSDSAGISRKIVGEERRSQLRDTMRSLGIPEGTGWIVRTASVDINEEALARDVTYLLKLWEDVRQKGQEIDDVGLVYEDHRSVMRFLREHYDPSIQEILVDDLHALEQVNEFVSMLPANQQAVKVRLHKGSRPIFNQFSVEDQIESIYQPQVSLPSGGSIVIDPTEALVAIDVNSGSTSKGRNFDESIFQANMEAASEFARQLRLRDLGGLVVVDFIDMRNKKHIHAVEKQVKIAMKRDKAKVDFTRISKFGLMQISRQKLGSPIEAGAYRVCQHCKGRGIVRAVETLALFYLRRIQTGASRKPVVKIECHFPLDVASYLLNNKRQEITEMENKYEVEIMIVAESRFKPAENEIVFHRAEKEKEV